jgi:hypothetical protein
MEDFRMMIKLAAVALVLLVAVTTAVPDLCHGSEEEREASSLILDIYVNESGKALMTGYADSIEGLFFLDASDYIYEDDTCQLFVLTDSLIERSGNDWALRFPADGYYDEYHVIFYLPASVELIGDEYSEGLEAFISESGESIVIDAQGYDIQKPVISIEYKAAA